MKVHHAHPLAVRTDCGRKFDGRLVRGDTIVGKHNHSKQPIRVTNVAALITCRSCWRAQP
jgi:hypothetical protein